MERFVEAVRQYPCLWDISSKEYRNIDKKEAAWKSIVEYLNSDEIKDVKEAKSEWKKLRDSHRDSLKRMKTRTGQAATNMNTWRYAEVMEFLLPYMKNRSRSTNLSSAETQSSETPEVQDDENINDSETFVSLSNNPVINAEASVSQAGRIEPKKRNADSNLIELFKEMEENQRKRQEDRDLRRSTNAINDQNAIDLFLQSMAITIKAMPTWMQNRIKKKIFLIVSDAEEELENYGSSVTPDSIAAGSSRSANYGYSTSRESMNTTMPAAAGSSRSANYGYSTSRESVNTTMPAAAGSSHSANYSYSVSEEIIDKTMPADARLSRSTNTIYLSRPGTFESDYDD